MLLSEILTTLSNYNPRVSFGDITEEEEKSFWHLKVTFPPISGLLSFQINEHCIFLCPLLRPIFLYACVLSLSLPSYSFTYITLLTPSPPSALPYFTLSCYPSQGRVSPNSMMLALV